MQHKSDAGNAFISVSLIYKRKGWLAICIGLQKEMER